MLIKELELLYKYAKDKDFIIETGGGGQTTIYLARASHNSGGIMVSIEIDKKRTNKVNGVDYQIGWSITYDDLIKKGNKDFCDILPRKRRKYPWADRLAAVKGSCYMEGETDLIRKSITKYQRSPDFFFCDTGEFCGLAEWNVINEKIEKGGIFACHDIYYPKSIKCFKVVQKIENSIGKWAVLEKTKSKQGLVIAEKIS